MNSCLIARLSATFVNCRLVLGQQKLDAPCVWKKVESIVAVFARLSILKTSRTWILCIMTYPKPRDNIRKCLMVTQKCCKRTNLNPTIYRVEYQP